MRRRAVRFDLLEAGDQGLAVLAPQRRRPRPPAAAVEQTQAEGFLQMLHVLAQGGMAQVHALGGAAHAVVADYGSEGLQGAQGREAPRRRIGSGHIYLPLLLDFSFYTNRVTV